MPNARPSLVPPPVWTLLFGAAMWEADRRWPLITVVAPPWNRLGWCVMALAFIAPFTAIRRFGRAGTTVSPHQPDAASVLVTDGVYAWTRNPMYLGLTVALVGWAVRLGSLTAFAGPLLFVPLLARVQILPEERALRARFGREYQDYCARVNRWLGRRSRGQPPAAPTAGGRSPPPSSP
ncbi:MAG TPA: isoprenylcysteine carboxylmethyltransferase family protein [Steroidobacteraceae bacterium]|nr:isoprenylcysteine carboxylmethyltransferase family protein [Steroidobacteraceae bacterium]